MTHANNKIIPSWDYQNNSEIVFLLYINKYTTIYIYTFLQ